MSDEKGTSTGGIGFTGLLAVLFIALKLLGKIDWSWFWVLSPIWISFAIWLVFTIGAFIYFMFLSRRL